MATTKMTNIMRTIRTMKRSPMEGTELTSEMKGLWAMRATRARGRAKGTMKRMAAAMEHRCLSS